MKSQAFGGHDTDKLYDEATEVTAKDGEVILDGPDEVDVKSHSRSCRRNC